jgi:hypothetical protein
LRPDNGRWVADTLIDMRRVPCAGVSASHGGATARSLRL